MVAEESGLKRDILNGLPHYRIDLAGLKITDANPVARGGQGVIVVGTLIPRKAFTQWVGPKDPGELGELGEQLFDGPDDVFPEAMKEWRSEILKELPAEEWKKLWFEASEKLFLERDVAVKQLDWPRDDVEQSTKFFKSFVNEVSLMASLSHANIIEFLGFVENEMKGDAWIIIPWQANGNVRHFLQPGEWDIPELISLVQDTAKGLEYLHTHDPPICHGDLKSFNILVNSSYRAVITDFGSARIIRRVKPETRSEQVPINDTFVESTSPHVKFSASTLDLTLTAPGYTLRWTAPEVLNDGTQDLPSDMWALGWICWEILTKKLPFDQLNKETAIIKHTMDGMLPAIRKDERLSHVLILCSLMSDCWIYQPAKRIDAPTFQRKVGMLPSETPSPNNPGDQKERSANLLHKLGRMYGLQDSRAKAESHYISAVEAATQTGDDVTLANALNDLGALYFRRLDVQGAKDLYNRAYKIYARIGNDLGTANALQNLGEVYGYKSEPEEAVKAFIDAHKIYSGIGNDLGAANVLVSLGVVCRAQSKNLQAEGAFRAAHQIHSRIGNDLGAGKSLLGLGYTYHAQRRNQEAE
ncbi:hypothetical protein FS837_002844 [Tulasnella sp. UAMH 9824]|nr:hypothetical protein FS837_002844 [Tulasnella sp. UAMH 9824]